MHNSPNISFCALYEQLQAQTRLPSDEHKNHQFITPLTLKPESSSYDAFCALVDEFVDASKGGRNQADIEKLKWHWEKVLLCLSWVIFQRSWLAMPLTPNAFSTDYWLQRYGFTYRPLKAVTHYLDSHDLVVYKRGKRYHNKPSVTRMIPKPELSERLWRFFLDTEQPIEPPYITINDADADWLAVVCALPASHPEVQEMLTINDFLREHRWACKAPVRLTYKRTPFQGGRLITPFQNLPSRTIPIRINTLIDQEPICEVDYSANHLRLNLAMNGGGDAGDYPYEALCDESNVESRRKVKAFVTTAIAADSRNSAWGACRPERITSKEFNRIEAACNRIFPKLDLFKSWSLAAQNMEGQVLKSVMLKGVDAGIVVLPIHDAVAVPQQHASWAEQVMLECWTQAVEGRAKARVKIDYPKRAALANA